MGSCAQIGSGPENLTDWVELLATPHSTPACDIITNGILILLILTQTRGKRRLIGQLKQQEIEIPKTESPFMARAEMRVFIAEFLLTASTRSGERA